MREKILVVGMGKSGIAAAELLKKKEWDVVLYDGNADMDRKAFFEKNSALSDFPLYSDPIPEDVLREIKVAVLSPGVPLDSPIAVTLKKHDISLSGEIELAYVFGKGQVVAITGTNGKTTTTALTGELLKKQFGDVHVVGNIGIPYTGEALSTTDESVVVAEISSFQLETVSTFAPKVSAILNITPDHLNRHHTMEAYIAAKESITKNQGESDVCILNYEDDTLRRFGETLSCRVIYFSGKRRLNEGYFYEDGAIYKAPDQKIIDVRYLNILGQHNYENAMAACAAAEAMGVSLEGIREGLREFLPVEHRIEFVCEKRGIRFYNDSKGTNPDAAIKGILAMDRKTCLIGGGYDKDSDYDDWIDAFGDRVKKLVLIGQTKDKIARCADKHGFTDYCFADSLKEAVDICYEAADSGDAVLLSPACASWDMFDNYEQRGSLFKEYARSLEE